MAYQCIDYKLKALDEELCIPLGKCEVFPVAKPLPDDKTVSFINVELKVYTEPTLSKAKAQSPEFNVLNESGDTISDSHGYFYIFVNGHLWREVTALQDGLLAEVDLVQHYGKNSRRYRSIPYTGLITPKKTIALNSEDDDLTEAIVHIAYSPIQWSWQYIMLLGGLHKNDPRQKLVPKPDLCPDLTVAEELLNARCQKVDLDEAQTTKMIYVQDPLGIAFNLMSKCQFNYLSIQNENTKITKKKHFDSGVLAYQALFTDELHQTKQADYYYFPTLHSMKPVKTQRTVFKDRSDAAKFLRSGAKNIDQAYLENYLSSDILEEHLQQLPLNQKALLDFVADKPKASYSEPEKYITIEHAIKDFATLEGLDYLLGFKWVADLFNIMVLDADSIGTFRPWKKKLPAEQTRLNNERQAKASAKAFCEKLFTTQHWITNCFAPPVDLYDIKVAGHAPLMESEINDGSGLFRYETFQEIHKQLHQEKQDQQNVLANKALKSYLGSATSTVGYITGAWGRISNQYATGHLEPHVIKIRDLMVITTKATGISEFSDIHIKNASAVIGEDAAVVGITNYKRVQVNRAQRRERVKYATKNPPANAVTITDAKGNVLAAHDPKSFGSNRGAMSDANWVDYNKLMGNYDLLNGEMVVVPKAHKYAMAYNNPDFKLGGADDIMLKGLKVLERGLPQVMLAFEVFNGTQLVAKFKAGDKTDAKFKLEIANALFALAAGSLEVAALYSSKAEALLKTEVKLFFRAQLGRVLLGAGVILGAMLSLSDAYSATKSHDVDAAFLHASAAVISVAGFLYLGSALAITPLGWAIIALGLVITLLAIAFTDNSIEKWAINGPFSRKASARCTGDYKIWHTHPIECYAALRNELFAPSMALSIQKVANKAALLNVEVVAPGFVVGQSEIIMVVNQITDQGILSFEQTQRLPLNNWRITQHVNTDALEQSPEAAQFLAEPQITGFTYAIPLLPTAQWGDELELDWQVKIQYALDSHTTLPYVDKTDRETWHKDDKPDKAWLIKEIEYE
ncbi:hypothetical protein [Litorilituus sediminis]|uniref:Transmembrane protein n=1 Tax=Litorilituus sediminis TaxID=718192 RepID=A0A4P6P1C4_9GAMM|nr:hypothetical protein [Litorilituus sediminis]QBG34901.1 hypothetical protein EMK97_03700 [Litorilituus sediminis]